MGIADLLARGAMAFAGGFFSAFDEPAVGNEILHARESVDVMDLVEDDKGEDLADAVDGSETIKGINVVPFGGTDNIELQVSEKLVVVVD